MRTRLPVVLLALVLVGCSDPTTPSAGPTPTTTSAAPTTVPPVTKTPIATTTPADPLSPKPGLETAPPPGQPLCKGTALTVTDADTIVTPSYKREVFAVRTTGRPCQLNGYPTVQLLDASGKPLPVKVEHGGHGLPAERPATYTLSRETSLSFEIGTARDGACRDVTSASVVLPQTSTAHRAATPLQVCGGAVGVSPVHRKADSE